MYRLAFIQFSLRDVKQASKEGAYRARQAIPRAAGGRQRIGFASSDVASDLEAYERFLKDKLTRLDNVASIETSFALGQVQRSEVLPLR